MLNIHIHIDIYGCLLEEVDSLKYLGVTFTSNLKWEKHISQARGSATSALNFLKRNLRMSSVQTKTAAYQTYVRPRAEYAVCAWDPHTGNAGSRDKPPSGLIGKIEMIQRKAARWVLGKDGARHRQDSVTDMLEKLKWRSLEQRRCDIRLTMMYKIHTHKVGITSNQLIPYNSSTGILGSAHPHRYLPIGKQNADQYQSFFPRTIRQWNKLDTSVTACKTAETFKSRVCRLCHRC